MLRRSFSIRPGRLYRLTIAGIAGVVAAIVAAQENWLARLYTPAGTLGGGIGPIGGTVLGVAIVVLLPVILYPRESGRFVARGARRFPRTFSIALGCAMTVAMLIAVELGFLVYGLVMNPKTELTRNPPHLTPGRENQATYRADGEVIFDVTYTLDRDGNRVTPQPVCATNRHILFVGCSFTFGAGVEDEETLPAIVAEAMPNWEVSNLARGGYGTANIYSMLQNPETLAAYRGNDALMVYVYFPGHVKRSIGTMEIVTAWGANYPYYRIENDKVLRAGTFATARPIRQELYSYLAHDPILKHFNIDLPLIIGDKDFRLTTRLISECRSNFQERFPAGKFVVVIFPTQGEPRVVRRILPFLDEFEIQYLDYCDALEGGGEAAFFPYDGHTKPEGLRVLGNRLTRDLSAILESSEFPN